MNKHPTSSEDTFLQYFNMIFSFSLEWKKEHFKAGEWSYSFVLHNLFYTNHKFLLEFI